MVLLLLLELLEYHHQPLEHAQALLADIHLPLHHNANQVSMLIVLHLHKLADQLVDHQALLVDPLHAPQVTL